MSFRDLHHGGEPLLLPNAWDLPSALAFLDAGHPAIGTTSFGVSAGLGRPDGGRGTAAANQALARSLRTLPGYLSMDIEDGYADDPEAVAEYVAELAVDGINIEDSTAEALVPAESLAAKVTAIKRRCPDVFVNARVDTYWLGQDATVGSSVARALSYVEAGADGVFVPGVSDPEALRELATAIPVPLNVLAVPGLSLAGLGALGVRRVSTGSLPYRAAIQAALSAAEQVRHGGELPPSKSYPDFQALLKAHAEAD